MDKIKINFRNTVDQSLFSESFPGFECNTYEIENNRAIAQEEVVLVNSNNIAQIIFDDGTEWIGNATEISEIFGNVVTRTSNENGIFELPAELTFNDGTRNIFKKIKTKVLNIFSKKGGAIIADQLGKHFDQKLMPQPGLKLVDKDFKLSFPTTPLKGNAHYLLLLHGTISSTEGSFDKLPSSVVEDLFKLYDGVIALDHYTLSVSPLHNAKDLLNKLPENVKIDIISHSRGGLIADIVARCDKANSSPFSVEEIEVFENNDNTKLYADLCRELNIISAQKRIEVSKMVRVACPAAGTTFLSKTLDHFLNTLLECIGFHVGSKTNPYYQIVKELILNVVAEKSNPESLPGLWSMVPDSAYQRFNNFPTKQIKTPTFIISGDSEIGGSILQTLGVILTNLFYRTANDFVVNTSSMHQGLRRENGYHKFLSKDSSTHHFGYFRNEHTAYAILNAIKGQTQFSVGDRTYQFDYISPYATDRGPLMSLLGFKPYQSKAGSNKPIVIVLPGIMGSTLDVEDNNVWMNTSQLCKGALVKKLDVGANNVQPSGVIDKYYSKLCEYLKSDFDVQTFAFDWRDSLEKAATQLKAEIHQFTSNSKRPVVLLAHSMGGKVVKALMQSDENFWKSYIARDGSRVLMLGTPWLGSHLIMEVLTGHSKRIKQLAFIDFKHDIAEILKTVTDYKGVWELLPINDENFEQSVFWSNLKNTDAYTDHITEKNLKLFSDYKSKQLNIDALASPEQFEKIFYIAGSDKTVCGYQKIKQGNKEKLQYLTTLAGDGSVTYDLGIPKAMPLSNIYSCNVNHGMLAAEPKIFSAIKDILQKGQTSSLRQGMPEVRGTEVLSVQDDHFTYSSDENEVLDTIFGCENNVSISDTEEKIELNVSVLNADLKYASYPVMVGHFENDGIVSAERALDSYLGYKLSERHRIGFYPGQIGESEITYHRYSEPKGALIVGMGSQDELTPYRLALSIEKAIIRYAFFFRDNYSVTEIKQQAMGISTMLIGSGYAGLPIMDSIRAIIQGVINANNKLIQMNNGLLAIREIQFVDHWEDMAQGSQKLLYILKENAPELALKVSSLKEDYGKKRRLSLQDNPSWWHTFTTTSINSKASTGTEIQGLSFSSSGNRARIEQENISGDLKLAEFLNSRFAYHTRWDAKLAKTLFELLIPNDFKSIIRNQTKILWKLDDYAAQFPWEMFHDNHYGAEPTFINAALIRQLHTTDYRVNPSVVGQRTALVIGDPDYENQHTQLPGARIEAQCVGNLLSKNSFKVNSCLGMKAHSIVTEMYSDEYKIIHIAAHGIHTPQKSGIVIGPNIYLTPSMLNQLSVIPELVFINCCYSGDVTTWEGNLYHDRNKLAANVGTQLIRMGVKAVVVCGWAVDDAAAKVFANTFYQEMLEGTDFGTAVQRARKACYISDSGSNTWGAYQCYGDPFYKLEFTNKYEAENIAYFYNSEAENELRNLLSFIHGRKVNRDDYTLKLTKLSEKINRFEAGSPVVTELIAEVHAALGNYEEAVDLMHHLLFQENADFKVSTLEQYCSLRGKLFIEMLVNNTPPTPAALKKLKDDIALIQKIGDTAERYALLGAASRRLLILDNNNKLLHLASMHDSFKMSLGLLNNKPLEKCMYPLSNLLLAEWLKLTDQNLPPKLDPQYLKFLSKNNWKDLVSREDHFKDYYAHNAIVKFLVIAKLFSLKVLDNKVSIDDEIEKYLMKGIRRYANLMQIKGEIEQFTFLSYIAGGSPDLKAFFDKMVQQLSAEFA